jgi:hypothetical protein
MLPSESSLAGADIRESPNLLADFGNADFVLWAGNYLSQPNFIIEGTKEHSTILNGSC